MAFIVQEHGQPRRLDLSCNHKQADRLLHICYLGAKVNELSVTKNGTIWTLSCSSPALFVNAVGRSLQGVMFMIHIKAQEKLADGLMRINASVECGRALNDRIINCCVMEPQRLLRLK